ncbi:hypothetical protein OAO55_01635 [Bacteroidales bacterium]|nr:hypothetical protein [Bacteroidales bacterium]
MMDTNSLSNFHNIKLIKDTIVLDTTLFLNTTKKLNIIIPNDDIGWFGISWSVWIPSVISIAVFTTGYLMNFFISQYRKKVLYKNYKTALYVWCYEFIEPLKKQAIRLKKFGLEVSNNDSFDLPELRLNKIIIAEINELGFKNQFDTFITYLGKEENNEKSKRFYFFRRTLDYLKNHFSQIEPIHRVFVEEFNNANHKGAEFENKFNEDTVALITSRTSSLFTYGEFITKISNHSKAWSEKDEKHRRTVSNLCNFIKLIEAEAKSAVELPGDKPKEFFSLLHTCNGWKILLEGYKDRNRSFGKRFIKEHQVLSKIIEELETLLEIFKNKKIKVWFN